MKTTAKLGLLGSLYTSQFMPFMFFVQAIPVFMRQQGGSLDGIGSLGLLILPWTFKFLWAPWIDRYGLSRHGHYRSWIICFQCLLAFTLIGCAFLNIQTQFPLLLICMFLACTLAASQDIATDALAVGLLDKQERGVGNGIQSAGGQLGAILGGGGILILLDRIGWTASLWVMAIVTLLCLMPILFYSEPKPCLTAQSKLGFKTLISFIQYPAAGRWLLVLLVYMLGEGMASGMLRPLLVDLGLSLTAIGWMLGVVSYGASLVGALVAGGLINQLGRKQSLIGFALLQAIAISLCLLPALGVNQLPILYGVSMTLSTTHIMAGTAAYTVMMDYSRPATAGSDFTLQTSVIFLGSILGMVVGGAIAQTSGYVTVFIVSVGVALLGALLVERFYS